MEAGRVLAESVEYLLCGKLRHKAQSANVLFEFSKSQRPSILEWGFGRRFMLTRSSMMPDNRPEVKILISD